VPVESVTVTNIHGKTMNWSNPLVIPAWLSESVTVTIKPKNATNQILSWEEPAISIATRFNTSFSGVREGETNAIVKADGKSTVFRIVVYTIFSRIISGYTMEAQTMFAGPGTDYGTATSLAAGQDIEIWGTYKDYFYAEVGGKYGFVKQDNVLTTIYTAPEGGIWTFAPGGGSWPTQHIPVEIAYIPKNLARDYQSIRVSEEILDFLIDKYITGYFKEKGLDWVKQQVLIKFGIDLAKQMIWYTVLEAIQGAISKVIAFAELTALNYAVEQGHGLRAERARASANHSTQTIYSSWVGNQVSSHPWSEYYPWFERGFKVS